ncbi:armadillo-type protein [Kalaharituber pfeilii]|nr:armadillo-type protein [Kalaharituber pfeilii]
MSVQDLSMRPEYIANILAGLERYNPETTTIFQDYVAQQCESKTYDCYANLALLKLYQFNPHLTKDETITNILVKALTVFPSSDFSLCLHLLPPNILLQQTSATDALSEAVQKLHVLSVLLESAQYKEFWATLDSDDLYADLVADCNGFEELIRVRIAMATAQAAREIDRKVLEGWINLEGEDFEAFVRNVCQWTIDEDGIVHIPVNNDNEAKTTVTRENVKFDQFSRLVKRAYEQPA